MTHLYSRSVGRTSLYTLYIDDYVEALDAGTLPEALRQLGFKTFCTDGQARPPLISEADYIAGFRRHWPRVKEEYEFYRAYLNEYSHSPGHSGHELDPLPFSEDDQRAIAGLTLAHPPLTPIRSTFQQSHHHRQPSDENPRDLGKLQAVAMSAANRRPSLLVNGLPSVQEDRSAANTPTTTQAAAAAAPATTAAQSPPSGSGSGAGAGASSATVSPSRDAAKLNMLRRMRPPPFQYAWTFWHDRHVAPATNPSTGASSVADAHDYENRLTVLLENIITAKPFWEAMNRFPLRNLKLKDAVHFFKRGVRPVWEDPRNVKGGAWTFRVPKDKSEALWIEILMLAVGEQFADVIQPRDDLCGLSFSVRFNSNLITLWHRDGAAQASIDGILATVLDKVDPANRPKDGSYYYKRHSEHQGYAEALAKATEAQAQRAAAEVKRDEEGKIEEAKVTEGEVRRMDAEEDAREQEEMRRAGLQPVE